MLAPKRIIHKKVHKPSKRMGTLQRGSKIVSGKWALKATSSSWLTSRQIEAARMSIARRTKGGKVFIRVFPHTPVTAKGLNMPMGKGVGAIDYFMFPVQPGRIIFEVDGDDLKDEDVREALRIASHKLPFTTKIISKEDNVFA